MAAAQVEVVPVEHLAYQQEATVGLKEVLQVDTEVACSCHQAPGHKQEVHTTFNNRIIVS